MLTIKIDTTNHALKSESKLVSIGFILEKHSYKLLTTKGNLFGTKNQADVKKMVSELFLNCLDAEAVENYRYEQSVPGHYLQQMHFWSKDTRSWFTVQDDYSKADYEHPIQKITIQSDSIDWITQIYEQIRKGTIAVVTGDDATTYLPAR